MGIKRYQIDRRVESLEDQVPSRRFILDEPAHELGCSVLRPQHTSSVMLRNAVQVSVACSVPSAHTHTHTWVWLHRALSAEDSGLYSQLAKIRRCKSVS